MELAPGIRYAVADRHGGVSAPPFDTRNLGGTTADDPAAVRRNRELTACGLGLDPARVVFMRQVHSAEVRYVTEPFGTDAPPLDAVHTDRPGLALAALAADCAPVLLADPVGRRIGAAHSGRVGTVSGVVPALVAAMAEHGSNPADLVALVGPLACGRCYEVPAAMREEACAGLPELWSTTRRDTPALDVRAGITAQLTRAGVTGIRHDDRCTMEDRDFFSHRREQTTGRFAAYVWLTD
ncbi:peptidoglycan editing factor PgeF [Kitasatospora sp. MBT63]|uniref:peptidoglycan editing factor PgeF n=1 Tax=Kitasatospora sp. MBT63 TaxID=1444768 RepID=UPI00053A47CB|nr:peptidoglycan editing factor PgeF [Kitasatospora sp. MBT63]